MTRSWPLVILALAFGSTIGMNVKTFETVSSNDGKTERRVVTALEDDHGNSRTRVIHSQVATESEDGSAVGLRSSFHSRRSGASGGSSVVSTNEVSSGVHSGSSRFVPRVNRPQREEEVGIRGGFGHSSDKHTPVAPAQHSNIDSKIDSMFEKLFGKISQRIASAN